jgi:hypothetical protein
MLNDMGYSNIKRCNTRGEKMKNKLLIYLGIIICLYITILGTTFVSADTGTYIIEKQTTDLTVQTDRNVVIEYYMKWKVTGGNIPWVTLGLPNSDYQIESYGGNAQEVRLLTEE